jgi:hypothetical protein
MAICRLAERGSVRRMEMVQQPQFVCFRWGDRYPEVYVLRLYNSVRKYFSGDFAFHCFTDQPLDLPASVQQHQLVLGQPFSGNFNKERVFARDFLGLEPGTPIIALDIDILITGNLNFLLTGSPDQPLIMAPGAGKNRIGLGRGSVYRVKAGALPHLWDDLLAADYQELVKTMGREREQGWLDRYFAKGEIALFPAGRVLSYKYHCKSKGAVPLGNTIARLGVTDALWRKAVLPNDARVVCFHGRPNMEDVADGRWGYWKHAPFVNEYLQRLEE